VSGCDPLRVHALHDGTLQGDSRAEAERHVAACADCARALAELRALDALAAEDPDVPAGYFEALPARIAARATRRPRAAWSRPVAWAGALAAALLIALVTPRLLQRPLAPAETALPPASAPKATRPAASAPPSLAAPVSASPAPALSDRASIPSADEAPASRAPAPATPPAPAASEQDEVLPAPAPALAAESREEAARSAGPSRRERQAAVAAETEAPVADAVMVQKSAAGASAGLAAGAGQASTAAPAPGALAQARAERDRLVREALQPGADLAAQRRAFDAAAAVMRAGGDDADRALLRARAEVYLARTPDPAERRRVRAVLNELATP
jgi:hypothetical protein